MSGFEIRQERIVRLAYEFLDYVLVIIVSAHEVLKVPLVAFGTICDLLFEHKDGGHNHIVILLLHHWVGEPITAIVLLR